MATAEAELELTLEELEQARAEVAAQPEPEPDARPAHVKQFILAEYVYPTACVIARRLAPHCRGIEIAGSLRRRAQRVGDAEIVLDPVRDADGVGYSGVMEEIARFVELGTIELDSVVKRNGAKLKRYVLLQCACVPLELYFADEGNFGNTLAIRTGSREFSRLLVTKRRMGGLMPNHLRQNEGYLRRGDEADSEIVPCPTEADFFAALGFADVPDPDKRTGELAEAMAKVVNRR